MAMLHIALQDGFAGNPVAIRLDGREVYRKPDVRTDLRISRADGIDLEVPTAGATIEVEAGGRSAAAQVLPTRTPYLAVNLDAEGRPALSASAEPFAYL